MKECWSTYHELNLTTRGTLSNCCVQHLDAEINWDEVDDLDEWFRNYRTFQRIRFSLRHFVEIPECESCWIQEKSEIISRRQYKNQQRETGRIPTIKKLDLRISNKCNLQCKMCVPNNSDQIMKLGIELHNKGITNLIHQHDKTYHKQTHTKKILDLALKLPNLEMITFAGGEPFIMPEVEEFLENMILHNKTHVRVEFITNCTVVKSKVINMLKKFENVCISCSIDGIEEQFEYQRYPAKWSVVEKNFRKIYEANFQTVCITPCISLLNLTNIHKFVEWANKYPKAIVIFNEVDAPTYLNFRYVPLEERQELINSKCSLINGDKNWKLFFNNLIFQYETPNSKNIKLLKEHSEKVWDYRCNYKFLDVYPWAKKYFGEQNE